MALARLDTWSEAGKWSPRSPYVRYWHRRVREAEMAENNEPPKNPKIGACPTCGLLFLLDETRTWSPCHGADPLVILDAFTAVDLVNVLAETVLQGTPGVKSDASSQPPAAPPGEATLAPSDTAPPTPAAAGGTNTQGETAAAGPTERVPEEQPGVGASKPASPSRTGRKVSAAAAASA
jgi:hypothetical protein